MVLIKSEGEDHSDITLYKVVIIIFLSVSLREGCGQSTNFFTWKHKVLSEMSERVQLLLVKILIIHQE